MSKSIKGSKTEKNLLKAFTGESQAFNRYKKFAQKAKTDGFLYIEKIFDDTANMEKQHAFRFFSFLEGGDVEITAVFPSGKLDTTLENLKLSIAGENQVAEKLYPMFSQNAAEEGYPEISALFRNISKIEADHAQRFENLLKLVETDAVNAMKDSIVWICMICGFVHVGSNTPMKCPVCLSEKAFEPREIDWYKKL